MRRSLFISVILLAGAARADEPSPPSAIIGAPRNDPAGTVPDATRPVPTPRRVLSPDTAAKLSAAAPKYVPAAEKETAPTGETAPVQREPDKPRNQIIRLPRFVVGEPKLHGPTKEVEVLTPKGRVDLALHRYPGLKFGPLAWLNNPIALEMLEEDLRLERRRQEADLWSLYLIHETPGERVVGR